MLLDLHVQCFKVYVVELTIRQDDHFNEIL